MRFVLLFERLVHPFRLSFHSLVVIAAPSSVVVAVIVSVVERLSVFITLSPVLGSVDSLSLFGNVTLNTGLRLEPRLGFAIGPVTEPSVGIVQFTVSSEVFEASRRALSNGGFAIPGWSLVISEISTHTSVKALSAIMSKALARLNCAPSIRFSLAVATTEAVSIATLAEAISVGVSIPTSKVAKSAWCFGVLQSFVINGFVPSSRGECQSRGAEDNVVGIYKVIR